MTPLIAEMVKLVPDPETLHWFDLGTIPKHVPAGRIEWDRVRHMPYPQTCCVFQTDETATKYAVILFAGEASISVAYVAFAPGKAPIFSRAIAIVEVDGELVYKINGQPAKDKQSVQNVVRVLVTVSQRIHTQTKAHRPTPAGTPAQQAKRKRHGKAPLFDWHTVTIQPAAPPGQSKGGTHASPRLHDRRGHWRKHPSGKVVWVKNCKVGNAGNGVVFKDYQLVTPAIKTIQSP